MNSYNPTSIHVSELMLRADREQPLIEKRRYPRIEVKLPAVYRSETLTVDAYVCNISQGGVNLTCSEADQEGTAAEVLITLPGQQESLRLSGTVIWCEQARGNATMGICFDELSRDDRHALANFLIARYYNS